MWDDVGMLLIFCGLQIADIISTLIFLHLGIREANPLVGYLINLTNPLTGLLLIKLIGIGLGLFCFFCNRMDFLKGINICYIIVVLWNLAAILTTLRA